MKLRWLLMLALTLCFSLGLLMGLPLLSSSSSSSYSNQDIVTWRAANAQAMPSTTTTSSVVSYHPFQLSYTLVGENYQLNGNATDGIDVKGFLLNPKVGMDIRLNSSRNDTGEIVLLLPKTMIDNITSVKAATGGSTVDVQIRQAFSNSTHSALQVAIPPGTQDVVINAAHVAPEFKFTSLIAGISFAGIIAFLAYKRHYQCAWGLQVEAD